LEIYPQLADKAVVDFVNGLEVLDDHIRFRRDASDGFAGRIWGLLTGEPDRRQFAMDEQITTALYSVKDLLRHHGGRLARSDLVLHSLGQNMTTLTEKLVETRDGLMRHEQRLTDLTQGLHHVAHVLVPALQAQMLRGDARMAANDEKDNIMARWKARSWNRHTPEQRLFLACNALYWGHFGSWLRLTRQYPQHHETAMQLLDTFRHQALTQLNAETRRDPAAPLTRRQLRGRFLAVEPDTREILGFLARGYPRETAPLPTWLGALNDGTETADVEKDLDYMYSSAELVHAMTEQALYRERP
jgi:hypothetical protein